MVASSTTWPRRGQAKWFVGSDSLALIRRRVRCVAHLPNRSDLSWAHPGGGRGASAVFCRLRRASNPRERSGEPTRKRLTPALFSMSIGVVLFASNTPFLINWLNLTLCLCIFPSPVPLSWQTVEEYLRPQQHPEGACQWYQEEAAH